MRHGEWLMLRGAKYSPPRQIQLIYKVRPQITISTKINLYPMTFYPNYCSLHMKCNGWHRRKKKQNKLEWMSEGWDKKRMNVWERECRLTDYFRLTCRSKRSSQHCHKALGWCSEREGGEGEGGGGEEWVEGGEKKPCGWTHLFDRTQGGRRGRLRDHAEMTRHGGKMVSTREEEGFYDT